MAHDSAPNESAAEWVSIDALHAWKDNPRRNDAAVEKVADSIRRFGFGAPILARKSNGEVIAGHTRVKAARKLGIDRVPVRFLDLDPVAAHLLALADNKTSDIAEWDDVLLGAVLAELKALDQNLTLGTGFSDEEVAKLIADVHGDDSDPLPAADPDFDRAEQFQQKWQVARGQLWTVPSTMDLQREHRIFCGDSTAPDDVARATGGERARLCFTSPPYGQQRDYGTKITNWTLLMQGVFSNPATNDCQILVNLGMVHREQVLPYWDEWIIWMQSQGWRRFGWYVWDQGPGLPGDWSGRLAPAHEFVFHFNREARRPNKIVDCIHAGQTLGRGGLRKSDGTIGDKTHAGRPIQDKRIADSVLRIIRHMGRAIETAHPAVFPLQLPSQVLLSFSDVGDFVYEPFLGSGTTLLAADRSQRICCGIEIEPKYCAVVLERLEQSGMRPQLVSQ